MLLNKAELLHVGTKYNINSNHLYIQFSFPVTLLMGTILPNPDQYRVLNLTTSIHVQILVQIERIQYL